MLQGFDVLPHKTYDHFPIGDPYRNLIQMAEEERSFWSQLKKCYKQQRQALQDQNVSVRH